MRVLRGERLTDNIKVRRLETRGKDALFLSQVRLLFDTWACTLQAIPEQIIQHIIGQIIQCCEWVIIV
jgi:hypothetical protein